MFTPKSSSLVLVIASIIGAITFIYLRSDFGTSQSQPQDGAVVESYSEEDDRADSELTATASAVATKSEESHSADCAHCAAAEGNSATIDPQLVTDPAHDRVFKELARMKNKVISPATFDFLRGSNVGEAVSFQIGEIAFNGEVSLVRENHPKARTYGIKLDEGKGRVLVKTDAAESMSLNIFFMNDRRIITAREFNFEGSGAGLILRESTIDQIICGRPDTILTPTGFYSASEMSALNAKAPSSNLPIPTQDLIINAFQSNSEAEYVMYLDFDGETVVGSTWNEFYGSPIVAVPQRRAGEEEWVRLVWRRAVEDFAPFDLNVTTDREVFDAADPDKRLQVIITSSTQVTRSGVALLYSFREDSPIVWVNHSQEYWCATTISHEAGHAFGLVHDSTVGAALGDDYYLGHNESYAPGWGPIMGAPFGDLFEDEVDQWSIGEYPNAENLFDRQFGLKAPPLPFEDDISIIGDDVDPQEGVTPRFQGQSTEASNGFGFVTDDYANSFNLAGVGDFEITGNNVIEASGLISTSGDVDVFEFEAPAGNLRFIVAPLDVNSVYLERGSDTAGANLAANARLLDVNGQIIAVGTNAGGNQLTSLIETSVIEGTYYLEVEGGGRGTGPETGFSDYGSLGIYNIVGELDLPPLSVLGGPKQSVAIFNGSESTDEADGTDFGFTTPSRAVTNTYSLRNFSLFETIDNIQVSFAEGADSVFSLGNTINGTIPPERERFLEIIYKPTSAGVDLDTVMIAYEVDGESFLYEFAVRGSATTSINKDNYENNNTALQAYDLTDLEDTFLSRYRGFGFFLSDATDWYSFTVDPEDDLIAVDFAYDDSERGIVFFELINFNGQTVANSGARLGRLQFVIPDNYTSANQRKFFIKVSTPNDSTFRNQYDLKWGAIGVITIDDDPYEPNNTPETAHDLTFSAKQLSLSLGLGISKDEDWYKLEVSSDPFIRMLYAAALFQEEEGNIDIEIYREAALQTIIIEGVANTGVDKEVLTYREEIVSLEDYTDNFLPENNTAVTGVSPGTYYVRVFGDFAGNNYDLIFEPRSDDKYEDGTGGLDNDLQENAFDLGAEIIGKPLSQIDGIGIIADYLSETADPFINGPDDDWYKFNLPEGINAEQITLEYQTDLSGELQFGIYDAAGVELVRTEDGSTDPGTLTLNNPEDREYFILVTASRDIDQLSGYDFTVNFSEETPFIEDPVEDNYEENDTFQQPFDIRSNEGRYLSSLDGYGTQLDTDWYWFTIPKNAARLTTSLFFINSDGDMDLTLSKKDGPVHFRSSNGTNSEFVVWDAPIPGNYALTVTGEDRGNFYNLIWDITYSEDNYEENDSVATAYDLTEFERRRIEKLNGIAIQADDDFYRIEAYPDTVEIRASVTFNHNEGDIDLALYDSTGSLISRSISTTNSESLSYLNPPAGVYYIQAYFGDEGNEYNLFWAAFTQDDLDQIPAGDDAYEENDIIDEPYVLADDERRLSRLLGLGIEKDDDWYQFEVAEGNVGLRLECTFDDSLGDIDVEIYDPLGFPLGVRDSIDDNELFVINSSVPVGTYKARVYGVGLGNEYDLYWNPHFEDIYEENDVSEEAYDITGLLGAPLSEEGVPTLSDDDWYVFTASADRPFISVELEYQDIDGAVNFELLDSSLNVLAVADSVEDFESVLVEVDIGTFYVRVYGDNFYNTYDLTVSVIGDDIYEENDIASQAAVITDTPNIEAVQFDNDWYSFEVTESNAFLSVGASFSNANGNIDIAIYDSGDLNNPLATSNSPEANNEGLRVEGNSGTYFIKVSGNNTNPFYRLFWTVSPDDEFEQNDTLEDATDITTQAEEEINALQFDPDWFEVSVDPGNLRLLVDLLFEHDRGDLNLTLYDSEGEELLLVDTDTDNEEISYSVFPFGTVAETFYLKVDGASVGTEYTLIWSVSREDNFEGETGNNTYFTASEDLLVSEGVRISDTIGYGGALNDDWYKVVINPGDIGIVIEAWFEHDDGTNIDLELFNNNQIFLKRSVGFSDVERINFEGAPGTYYLRVFGTSGKNPYNLVWNSYAEDNLETGYSLFVGGPPPPPDNDTTDYPRGLQYILPNLVRGSTDLEFILLDNLTLLDEDWYLFDVREGEDIFLLELNFEHLRGDIDVALYKFDEFSFQVVGDPIAWSESEEDIEQMDVPDLEPGFYVICVYGYGIYSPKSEANWLEETFDPANEDFDPMTDNTVPGESSYYEFDEPLARALGNTYSMRWISTTDDIYDIDEVDDPDYTLINGVEINDSFDATAEPVLVDQWGQVDSDGIIDDSIKTYTYNEEGVVYTLEYQAVYTYAGLSQLDDDWYRFTVNNGGDHDLFAAISFSDFQANIDLFLYDESGNLLASSEGNASVEFVEYSASGTGTYYIKVVGEDMGTPYTLQVRGFFDDIYEDNEVLDQADQNANITDLTDGLESETARRLTGLVQRDVDLYRFDIPEHQVHLSFSSDSFVFPDLRLLHENGEPVDLGYYESGFGEPGWLSIGGVISPEPGTYYLEVTGGNTGFSYELIWNYDNIDEYEAAFVGADSNFDGTPDDNNTPANALEYGVFGSAGILSRARLEPVYDPDNNFYTTPIQEFAFNYDLLGNLVMGRPLFDPFGHGIQEADDWYLIQVPEWEFDSAKKGPDTIQVLKRIYNTRFNVEIEFTHLDGNINMEIYDANGITDFDAPDGGVGSVPLARSVTANDKETLSVAIDPTFDPSISDDSFFVGDNEGRYFYVRVFGDNAANDYSLKWDFTKDDAFEQLEDELLGNDTNDFVDKAFDLTHVDAWVDGVVEQVSTEKTWLHEVGYLQDVNGDGNIDEFDDEFASTLGYGSQKTDDWYAVVVSEGSTQITVDLRSYSDNDTGYIHNADNLDMDFEVYFLAGNDGFDETNDLRHPVLVGRSIDFTDNSVFVTAGYNSKELPEDVTQEIAESATFDVAEPGIYLIRIYYDFEYGANRIDRRHPYTFKWDDIGDPDDADDSVFINDFRNGNWDYELPEEFSSEKDPTSDDGGEDDPGEGSAWYEGFTELAEGWRYSDWFKDFRLISGGWIYHGRHGWLYVSAENTDSLFLWDPSLSRWLWTSEAVYPWIYSYGTGEGWLFFFEGGSPGARFFKRADNGQVMPESALQVTK